MTAADPLSDALSGLDNAESVGHLDYTIRPASNLIGDVLAVLDQRGYIGAYTYVDDGKAGTFEVELTGAINECGAIKPRYSVSADAYEQWEKRYLPAQDYGALIVTTSRGVMSHDEARESGVGGQVLAYVY